MEPLAEELLETLADELLLAEAELDGAQVELEILVELELGTRLWLADELEMVPLP